MDVHLLELRRDLVGELGHLSTLCWPRFLLDGNIRKWSSLLDTLASYQTLFTKEGRLLGAALTSPCVWSGVVAELPESLDAVVYHAALGEIVPTHLCAVAALVHPEMRGRGFSRDLLRAMVGRAESLGLEGVIAPVRPTLKAEHPDVPIEEYVEWKREDGTRFDPWLRTHDRIGGELLRVGHDVYGVEGTLAQWEEWTGLTFPESGPAVVPGAINRVVISREEGRGIYMEPGVWYFHRVQNTAS